MTVPPDPRADAAAPGRWATAVLLVPMLAVMAFNAVTLWPEVSIPVPSLNDDAVHYLMVQRASEALRSGASPIDHWVPDVELGFPAFVYYQNVPHLTVVFLHRLLLGHVELLTVFNLVRYLLLVGFPLIVYWSLRRMEFSRVAASVGAAGASLFSTDGRYGFEYGSYIWRGFGMYTQLWAMPLSFVTLASLDRLIARGKGYLGSILACSLLALSHLIYAYMMAISALVLLLVGADRANFRPRLVRLGIVGAASALISAYMTVPFVLGKAFLAASPYLQRWKYDSFGARDVLKWLIDGDLLDHRRLPVLTAVLALGVAAALLTRTRQARVSLVLFVVWLAFFFGRVTWGRLADLLPMHEGLLFHRFVGGVDIAAVLLIGLGGEWLWRQLALVPGRWRPATVALLVMLLLLPALRERRDHYAANAQWMERTWQALETDRDAQAILAALETLPPGRTYVGLRADWGKQMRFGDLHFYDLLTFHRIAAASPPYSSWSLNADIIWHVDDHNPAHYDTLDIRYVVAPRGWTAPAFLRPIKETGRYVLYEASTSGYAQFVSAVRTAHPRTQASLFFQNRSWFQSQDPAARRFVENDFPPGRRDGPAAATADAGEARGSAACVGEGKVTDQRVEAGRIDVRAECPVAGTLVLKVTYHPNWQVTVDGHAVPTFMLSPSFIGVNLPAGSHEVRAEYRAGRLKTLLLVLGAVTLLSVIGLRRRFSRIEALLG